MGLRRRTVPALALSAVVALTLAACGSDGDADDAATDGEAVTEGDTTSDEVSAPGGDTPDVEAVRAAWLTTVSELGKDGEFEFDCPAGGEASGSVWGGNEGRYTHDSSICTAAVHAGVITTERGGTVHVTVTEGLDSYESSTANGVTTESWGPWDTAFEVSAAG